MEQVILIGDFNHNDLDDEMALIVAIRLHQLGYLNLLGVIANTSPAYDRARIARGLLDRLGMSQIPVGVGAVVTANPEPCPDLHLIPYLSDGHHIVNGHQLILDILKKSKTKEVTLAVNASLTDLTFIPEHLLIDKVKKVAFMGGVALELSSEGYLLPGDAMNVLFDKSSALRMYKSLQSLGIPMIITTRIATFAATLDHSIFDEMGDIGKSLSTRVKQNTQRFWLSCCAPAGSPLRGLLGISRNRDWFVKTFCGGINPDILDDGNITPFIKSHSLPVYDAVNVIAAVDVLRDEFMIPKVVTINNVPFLIIGWSPEENGIKNPPLLVEYMNELLVTGSK